MSHRIIISSVAPTPAPDGLVITHVEEEVVNVTVEYIPPHDLSDKEVGKRVTKLLKQVKEMQGEQAAPETPEV